MRNLEHNNNNIYFIDKLLEDNFYSKIVDNYIPCIIEKGNLQDNNSDLYIKTILASQTKDIEKTWMINNLVHSASNDVFNCIVSYNYKFNTLYGINPFLMDDYSTVFVEQKNLYVLDMVYNDSGTINKPAILKNENNNIYIYYDVLKEKLQKNAFSNNYKMYAEIEYREYVDQFYMNKQIEKINNGYIDVQCFKEDDGKNILWIRATIEIDVDRLLDKICTKRKFENLNIKVVELESGKIRDLNTNNYDDDISAGLIVFKKEAYQVLSKYYYFYDMMLVSKNNELDLCLIDNLEDCFVFWEGEFNSKIPIEIKRELAKYNDKNRKVGIISKGMYEWQLNANWNYIDDALPNEKLASYIRNNYLAQALEIGLDFYPPKSNEEYGDFVNLIFKILKISYKDLKISNEKIELLEKIRNKSEVFANQDLLYKNYQGFCNLINRVVENANN